MFLFHKNILLLFLSFVSQHMIGQSSVFLYHYTNGETDYAQWAYYNSEEVWFIKRDYPYKISHQNTEKTNKYSSFTTQMLFEHFPRVPNKADIYRMYDGPYRKKYTGCIALPLWGFRAEYPFLFDCHNGGLYEKEYDLYYFLLYAKCKGYYYLDTHKNYKIYQFIYYYKTKLGAKRKVMEIDFCPKLGMIRHKSFEDLREGHITASPLKSIFRGKVLTEYKLSTINSIPLVQIIQKDTCFTPFCDIDKAGCE